MRVKETEGRQHGESTYVHSRRRYDRRLRFDLGEDAHQMNVVTKSVLTISTRIHVYSARARPLDLLLRALFASITDWLPSISPSSSRA